MASMSDRLQLESVEAFQPDKLLLVAQDAHADGQADEELQAIAKGAGIAFVGKVIGGVVQYLYLILLARFLGLADFGLFVLALTIIDFVGHVSRLGFDGGVVKYVSCYLGYGDIERIKGSIFASLGFSLVSSIIIAMNLSLFAEQLTIVLFGKPDLAVPLHYLAFTLPFAALTVVSLNATQGFQRMDFTFYGQNIFNPLCQIMLAALFLFAEPSLGKACTAYAATAIATALLSLFLLTRAFPLWGRVKAIVESRELLRFSLPFLLVTLLMYLMIWTDILIMGHFRSSAEVGIYSASMKTAFFINTILLCFSHIFSPIISKLYASGEMDRLQRLFKTVTRWTMTVCMPFFLIMSAVPGDILSVFGSGFAAGSIPLLILASAQLLNAGTGPVAHMLVMSGRQDWMILNTIVACLINALLNWILVQHFGGLGAAIASGCAIVVFNVIMLLEVRFLLGMHPYETAMLRPVAAGLIAGLLTFIMRMVFTVDYKPLRMMTYGGVALASYAIVMFRVELTEEDRIITDVIKQKWATIRGNPC